MLNSVKIVCVSFAQTGTSDVRGPWLKIVQFDRSKLLNLLENCSKLSKITRLWFGHLTLEVPWLKIVQFDRSKLLKLLENCSKLLKIARLWFGWFEGEKQKVTPRRQKRKKQYI